MVNNRIGRKFIGATLSMAMAVTAVPAMTSLACENAPQGYGATESVSVDPRTSAVQNLHDLLDKMLDLGNDHSEELNAVLDFHEYCTFVHYGVDVYYNDELYSTPSIISITEILNSIYDEALKALNSTSEPAAARAEALQDLYNTLNTMLDYGISHAPELNEVIDFQNYCGWIYHGEDVYYHNNGISTQEIIDLTNTLNGIYNAAVEALRASDNISLPDIVIDNDEVDGFITIFVDNEEIIPAEEIAPDYGMNLDEDTDDDLVIEHPDDFTISPDFQIDPQDSFTIDGEQPEDVAPDFGIDLEEDIPEENLAAEAQAPADKAPAIEEEIIENETPAEETVATADETPATTSVPSAPAIMVAGAARNIVTRESMAEQIVERLYETALNRKSDAAGKAYWVRMILAGNGNIDMVVSGFLNSAEFNARNLTDDEFVTALYTVILNRVPTSDENTLWTNALTNGASRRDVINAFVNSSEFETTCEAYDL